MKKTRKTRIIAVLLLAVMATVIAGVGYKSNQADAKLIKYTDSESGLVWRFFSVEGDNSKYATDVYLDGGDNETIPTTVTIPDVMIDSKGVEHKVQSIGYSDTVPFFFGFSDEAFQKEIDGEIFSYTVTVDATNCTALEEVKEKAFYRNNDVKSLLLPKTVTHVGSDAFTGSTKIKVTFQNPNMAIDGSYDGCTTFIGPSRSCVSDFVSASSTDATKYVSNGRTTYKMTLNPNNGTAEDGVLGTYVYVFSDGSDKDVCGVKIPARTHYDFQGFSAEDGTQVFDSEGNLAVSSFDSDMTLKAGWESTTYTIQYDTNGANESIADQTVSFEDKGFTLNSGTLTRTGYVFKGWQLNNTNYEAGKNYSNTYLTETDYGTVKVTAVWEPITYTLSFDSNSGNGEMLSQTLTYDDKWTLGKNNFSRTGYDFKCWNTKKDGSGVSYNNESVGNEDKTQNFASEQNAAVTLYAQWNPIPYTIVFDSNGGTGTMNNMDVYYNTSSSAECAFTRTGYKFAGWSVKKEDGSFSKITKFDGLTSEANTKVTVYAQWTANTYKVSFDTNGGTETADKTCTYDESFILPENTAKTGYTFEGWSKSSSAKTVDYKGGEEVTNLVTEGEITLYAVWSINRYDISYDSGKEDVENPETVTATVEDTVTLPTLAKTGYTFKGWTNAGSDEIIKEIKNPTDNYSLTAKWETNTYKVVFDTKGGSTVKDEDCTYDESFALSDNVNKTGYTFAGWSRSSTAKTADYQGGEEVTNLATGGEITLYAVWNPNSYVISYESDCDDVASPKKQTVTPDDTLTLPVLTREGYTFNGWKLPDSDETVTELKSVTKAMTLTAQWEKNEYPITVSAPNMKKVSVAYDTVREKVVTLDADGNGTVMVPYGASLKTFSLTADDLYRINNAYLYDGETLITKAEYGTSNKLQLTQSARTVMPAHGLTLKVTSGGRKYSISYKDYAGNTLTPVISGEFAVSYEYGVGTSQFPDVDKEINGMYFTGWRTDDGEIITEISKTTYGDVALTAAYSYKSYNITYDLAGGTADISGYDTKYTVENSIKKITVPVRDGYTFIGWYCRKASDEVGYFLTEATENNKTKYTIDNTQREDLYLIAKWSDNSSTMAEDIKIENQEGSATEIAKNAVSESGFYFNQLNDIQKRIYTTLLNQYGFDMKKKETSTDSIKLSSSTAFKRSDVVDASICLIREHPEIFWTLNFAASEVEKNIGVYTATVKPIASYNMSTAKTNADDYEENWNAILENLKSNGIEGKNTYEKIKMVDEFVCKTYSYRNTTNYLNTDTTNETRSVGYMMSQREGCCVSYAKLTKLILDNYGITNELVSSINHMWNFVQIDGKWYLLDTTWDDSGEGSDESYFLKGSKNTIFNNDECHVAREYYYYSDDENGNIIPFTEYGYFKNPDWEENDYESDTENSTDNTNNDASKTKKTKVNTKKSTKKIALNKKKVTLKRGKKLTLKLKNASGKIKWKSSNKKIATVSSKGKVKVKKKIKALTKKKKVKVTITATYKKKKYKCVITVKR